MTFRPIAVATALVASATLSLTTLAAAEAAPPPPVENLQVTGQVQGAGTVWSVSATWDAATGADRYIVAVVDQPDGTSTPGAQYGNTTTAGTGATVQASELLTGQTYWLAVRPTTGGDIGTVTVAPFQAMALDVTGPTGTFTMPRTTDWIGNGYEDFRALPAPFRAAEPIFGEENEDSGSEVGFLVRQTALADDTTAAAQIGRQIRLDAGAPLQKWREATATLVYSAAGVYHPEVVLTDQYGNTSTVPLPTVTVKLDDKAPVVRLRRPRPEMQPRIAGWRVIRGTVADRQSGPLVVGTMVAQRRQGIWWVYDFDGGAWDKGFRSLPRTLSESEAFPSFTEPFNGRWRTPYIRGLRSGTLHVETIAFDRAMNLGFGPTVHRYISPAS